MGRRWRIALALMAPAMIPYVAHVAEWKAYSLPTGYIQPDMPVYVAKAREAFDDGRFHVLYGNPSGGAVDEPRIYFQPWTFALGLIHHLTSIPPGILWVAFAFVAAWGTTRAAIAVYEDFVGLDSRAKWLGLVAFVWGGGCLAVAGVVRELFVTRSLSWDDLFAFDPAQGWWFLNLGRNFVYPTESLYHALAFLAIVYAARGRVVAMLMMAALTASCSPFAGLEVLAILGVWAAVETLRFACSPRSHAAPANEEGVPAAAMLSGLILIIAAFFAYYVGFLDRFPEHRELARQMATDWRYSLPTFTFAYGPVLALSAWRMRSRRRLLDVVSSPRGRLLIAWAVASLILENHDFLVSPRQPIHFTRGYAWSALFLLGAPALVEMFSSLKRAGRLILLAAILSDNAAWFAKIIRDVGVPDRNGVRLTSEGRDVLRRLNRDDLIGGLVVCEDERLSYLTIAETRLRSWVGHALETPGYAEKRREVDDLFDRGIFPKAWEGRPILVVRYRRDGEPATPDWLSKRGADRPIFENRKWQIFQIGRPAAGASASMPRPNAR